MRIQIDSERWRRWTGMPWHWPSGKRDGTNFTLHIQTPNKSSVNHAMRTRARLMNNRGRQRADKRRGMKETDASRGSSQTL